MRAIAVLCLLFFATGFAAKPEDGPYTPTMSDDFWRKGELYPSALGLRPWKPADPKEYAGRFVGISETGSSIEVQVNARSAEGERQWRTDGVWKHSTDTKAPREVSWTNASLEIGSKHTYAEAARGCFFIFFVLYRDPDQPQAAPRPALLIGDRLFARE